MVFLVIFFGDFWTLNFLTEFKCHLCSMRGLCQSIGLGRILIDLYKMIKILRITFMMCVIFLLFSPLCQPQKK